MKRVCVLLASGLLLLAGSAVRAGDGGAVPGTLHLGPMPHGPAQTCSSPSCAAPACCAPAACEEHCGGHCGCFRDWLLYKPVSGRCACCCQISNCWPPLHTWFLDMCQGCGNGCGHAAPAVAAPCAHGACGDGGCAHPARPLVFPHD